MDSNSIAPSTLYRTSNCSGCPGKPCEYLRCGNLHSGNYVIVHNNRFGLHCFDCPLAVHDAVMIENYLHSLSLDELTSHLHAIRYGSNSAQQLLYDYTYHITNYMDFHEHFVMMMVLWKQGVFSVLQTPVSLSNDKEEQQDFFRIFEGFSFVNEFKEVEEVEEEETVQPAIINLQWKKDGKMISQAHVHDEVELCADVRDIDNGTSVALLISIINDDGKPSQRYLKRTEVKDSAITFPWETVFDEDAYRSQIRDDERKKDYLVPQYVFSVRCPKLSIMTEVGPELNIYSRLKIRLAFEDTGLPIADAGYKLVLNNDTTIEGTTNKDGYAVHEDLEFGKCRLVIDII